MGCSKRYLHQVFAAEHVTIERHIWRLRIEHCCQALAEQGQSERSISEIAFEWGFNSSAHFSRLFKSQVGVAPTSYRRGRIAGSPVKPAAGLAWWPREFATQRFRAFNQGPAALSGKTGL